jgi:hypothetical protein
MKKAVDEDPFDILTLEYLLALQGKTEKYKCYVSRLNIATPQL